MLTLRRQWTLILAATALLHLSSCSETGPGGSFHAPYCGDGVVDAGEACDDGNQASGDGCSSSCEVETPPVAEPCDGLEDGEVCDDGRICIGGVCLQPECEVDGDCGASKVCHAPASCDLNAYRCVAGAPVEDGEACFSAEAPGTCQSGSCVADETPPENPCEGRPHGEICDTGKVCLAEQCVVPECQASSHCAPATVCRAAGSCDATSFQCLPGEALFGAPCPNGLCDSQGRCDVRAADQKVCNLTGPGTSSAAFGVVATDLGIAVRQPDGQMAYIFGDTFSGGGVGQGDWRSPVLLRSPPGLPSGCIQFTSAAGGNYAKQIIDYDRVANPGISTWLPSDAITIGDRMYLHVIANSGLGNVVKSQIAYSDDNGENWTLSDTAVWAADANDHLMQLWTWERGDDGYVYIFSTKFISRDRSLILHRVPEDQLLNPSAYEPWGWNGSQWGWGNLATIVLGADERLGELSLRRIEGTWVLAYFNAREYSITVKVLPHGPTSNLYTAPTYAPVLGGHWGDGGERSTAPIRVAQVYGAYIHPDSTLHNLHLILSQWNTDPSANGWPYRSLQVLVGLPR